MTPPIGDEFIRTILENLSEGVCATDLERHITYWNRGAERISGYAAEEVVGKRCSSGLLVHVDDRGRPVCGSGCLMASAIDKRVATTADLYIRHKQGHRVPVSTRFAPLIEDDGEVVGALQVFRETPAGAVVQERIRELEKLSFLDPLTNLANRRYTDMTLEGRCRDLVRGGPPFGVILIDIDNLKQINDVHGHDAGDTVLRTVARTLLLGSRPFDVKGRWGGDEFIAIVANVEPPGLSQAAERFRALIENTTVPYGDGTLSTTASVGATMAIPGETVRDLLRRADRELYASKSLGKNRASVTGTLRSP